MKRAASCDAREGLPARRLGRAPKLKESWLPLRIPTAHGTMRKAGRKRPASAQGVTAKASGEGWGSARELSARRSARPADSGGFDARWHARGERMVRDGRQRWQGRGTGTLCVRAIGIAMHAVVQRAATVIRSSVRSRGFARRESPVTQHESQMLVDGRHHESGRHERAQ